MGEKTSPFFRSLGKFSSQARTNQATPLPQAFFPRGKMAHSQFNQTLCPSASFLSPATQWYKIFMKVLLVQSLEAFHLLACLYGLTPLKFYRDLRVSNSSQIAN